MAALTVCCTISLYLIRRNTSQVSSILTVRRILQKGCDQTLNMRTERKVGALVVNVVLKDTGNIGMKRVGRSGFDTEIRCRHSAHQADKRTPGEVGHL